MSNLGYINNSPRKYRSRRRKSKLSLFIIAIVFLIVGIYFLIKYIPKISSFKPNISTAAHDTQASLALSETDTENTVLEDELSALLANAQKLALGYDYDAAIDLLSSNTQFSSQQEVQEKISEYTSTKSGLIRQDINKITHVFFHTLIVDSSKTFDGDNKARGYNQVMTTIDEFKAIIQSMYDKGFVLVGLHDMAYEVDDPENGGKKMVEADIMLPEGKKAFVMSQDDVCYYEYMAGDGFASRLIIGDDGRVTCEMDMENGQKQIGAYDLIPILNEFIDAHPDFSYKGAKAIIAVTGYNGVFGYRTDESYSANESFEADKEAARKIADALRNDGWELASHSWGHRHLGKISFNEFKTDCDKWESQVEPLIGDTDIILYPFGTDVNDWKPYTNSNERYMYMHNLGFRYFCTVDSSKYWVQLGKDYLRQGRRNLDGYRMWRDLTEPENQKLNDLFDVKEVFDKSRPTPVSAL